MYLQPKGTGDRSSNLDSQENFDLDIVVLQNSSVSTISPTFSSPPTFSHISPLTNSSLHQTDTRTFPHSSPMPCSLRWNSVPIIDVLPCFTFLVSDPFHSSTSPSVHWPPFLSHIFSSLDSTAAPHSLCSTGSSSCFPFRLCLLRSLVNTLSYNFSFSLYDTLFSFLLGLCAPLYSI